MTGHFIYQRDSSLKLQPWSAPSASLRVGGSRDSNKCVVVEISGSLSNRAGIIKTEREREKEKEAKFFGIRGGRGGRKERKESDETRLSPPRGFVKTAGTRDSIK